MTSDPDFKILEGFQEVQRLCLFDRWIRSTIIHVPEDEWTRENLVVLNLGIRDPGPSSHDDAITGQNAAFVCPHHIGIELSIIFPELDKGNTLEARYSALWGQSVNTAVEVG